MGPQILYHLFDFSKKSKNFQEEIQNFFGYNPKNRKNWNKLKGQSDPRVLSESSRVIQEWSQSGPRVVPECHKLIQDCFKSGPGLVPE